jgi:hypothetical protein
VFDRPHHRLIASVLEALDAPLLRASHCLFGGGTAIVLGHGEYRESVDLDFLVSDLAGYRHLRQLLTGADGLAPLWREAAVPKQAREVRADQYGVRTTIELGGHEIKFEIVLEGRIELAEPARSDSICGVATLTPLDMATSKLLANSDRWRDDSVFGRDLIDLAMMSPPLGLFRRAVAKAEPAYGVSVLDDLAKAIEQLKDREGRLERCMKALGMQTPKAVLWQKIRALERILPRSGARTEDGDARGR